MPNKWPRHSRDDGNTGSRFTRSGGVLGDWRNTGPALSTQLCGELRIGAEDDSQPGIVSLDFWSQIVYLSG
jgi:hypothetical protein